MHEQFNLGHSRFGIGLGETDGIVEGESQGLVNVFIALPTVEPIEALVRNVCHMGQS